MGFIGSMIGGALKPITSLVGGIMGSGAAKKAAGVEATAAENAQALELKNQQAAQGFQNDVWSGTQAAEKPYQELGQTSAGNLAKLLSQGFTAPTLAEAEQTPGYQFTLGQGQKAIDQSAAARGNLFSGNTGAALEQYGQGLASTTYQQDYQNALNTYMANYQSLLGGTDVGLSSTGQLASAGQAAAGNMANIDLTGGAQQAEQILNAAKARASGYLGSASAWTNAIGGIAGSVRGGLNNLDTTGSSTPWEQAGNFFGGM